MKKHFSDRVRISILQLEKDSLSLKLHLTYLGVQVSELVETLLAMAE